MISDSDFKALIHHTLYKQADVNSQIPDVDQMAVHLYNTLQISKTDLEHFTLLFMHHLADEETLRSCFYPGVMAELEKLVLSIQKAGKSLRISSWTQGNVFLQTQKALVFQNELDLSLLANPSVYASLDKMSILPQAYRDLAELGCDLICLVDDRLPNVLAAHKKVGASFENLQKVFVHKIRPDKKITHRLSSSGGCFQEVTEWSTLIELLAGAQGNKIGLLLDKDGIIYNTTLYRKKLETTLIDFLKSFS